MLSAPSHNPGEADRLGVDRHPFWKTHGFPTTILAKKGETVSSEGPFGFSPPQGIVQQLLECVALMLGRKRFEGQREL